MAMPSDTVSVNIRGQLYPIRSRLDSTYVTRLARYVDDKMKTAAASTPTADSARLAVLAALNIADDYFQSLERDGMAPRAVEERTQAIEHLVDEALRLAGDA